MSSEPVSIYFALAIGVVSLAALLWLLPDYWRGRNKNIERVPAMWLYSPALYRGLIVRSGLTIILLWATLIGIALYAIIVGPEQVAPRVFWSWLALFMAELIAVGTITLFNQPKFLVPPFLRHEPGVMETWWRAEREAVPNARRGRWLLGHLIWVAVYLMVLYVLFVIFRPHLGQPLTSVVAVIGVLVVIYIHYRVDPVRFRRENP